MQSSRPLVLLRVEVVGEDSPTGEHSSPVIFQLPPRLEYLRDS
jgi:hypothetical protein